MFAALPRDRFYFTTLLAAGIHAVLLLGFSFNQAPQQITAAAVAIELKQGGDAITQDGAPEQTSEHTPEHTPEHTKALTEPKSDPLQSVQAPPNPANRQTLQRRSPTSKDSRVTSALTPKPLSPSRARTLDTRQLAEQIVLFDQRAAQAQGDARRRDLSTAGAPSTAESAYLAMWRRKCERLGGNNYPAGRLQGELTLRVSIHHTGRLLDVALLRSSGHEALDAAALKTVRQAAPYQPFNVDMRKRYDELTFTRTWQFSRSGSFIN